MKKLILFCLSMISSSTYTAVGCLNLPRYKQEAISYEYVACACNCKQYEHLIDRGMCIRCRHFHSS